MKIRIKIFILMCLIMIAFNACTTDYSENVDVEVSDNESPIVTQTPETVDNQTQAEILLDEMSLEEKIAQLFIVRPETFTEINSYEIDEMFIENIEIYPVAGVAFFADNIINEEQVSSFISDMQENIDINMFISIDEEGGIVSRIANNDQFDVIQFSSMEEIGKTQNVVNATVVGATIASYLKDFGFNYDFAPVCDVNTNPENTVIGERSYGSDPEIVADMVEAEILAMQEVGVISSAKHFPGHGDTTGDTHDGFVTTDKTLEELMECELIPFESAIDAGVSSIMVSHITCPNVDDSGLPASLSYEICTELLRNQMNYDGLIITDGMEMGAIVDNYTSAQSAVLAIQAGVDIILLPQDFYEAYNGVLDAVNNGEISIERINESVLRILSVKEEYGIL